MNQKLFSKVLATMLVVTLTFANFIMLGVYATKSYAMDNSLENQKTVSNNENVNFDAYFKVENESKIHSIKKDIDETTNLFLSVDVAKGYLKNAKISIIGQDGKEANFKVLQNEQKLELVENIDANTISLKQINAGTEIVLEVPISSVKEDLFDLSNFNKINNITLTGSYIGDNGKETKIEKTINVRNEWTKEVNLEIEQETKTFMPYEVKDAKGTILQTIVKTGLENNALPIKQTKLSIKVPEVEGVNLKQVLVTANTKATNNKEFTYENYTYNKETGIIDITVNNEINENKVSWEKLNKDEYIITYIFEEKIQKISEEQEVNVEITAYNVENKVNDTNTLNIEESKEKGNFVTTQIEATNTLSKGYLYTNLEKEVEYFENIKLNISYADIIDKIIVENSIDNFIDSKGKTSGAQNNTYYKTTSVAKSNFEKILGIDGYIKIIGTDGEQLAIFTKETAVDENGNYTFSYNKLVNNIKVETSKPIANGELQINNVKILKGKNEYTTAQVADFEKLQLKLLSSVEYAGTVIEKIQTSREIELIAPSTKIEAQVNKADLSTVVKNENVELRVILKTNDITCDLYKNPVVEIILPNYISEIEINDVNLFFDKDLKIKKHETYKNKDGNIVIKVTVEGEDLTYSQDEISKGANIVINANLTVQKLTPTKQDVMKVYVTNELATIYKTAKKARSRVATQSNAAYAETNLNAVAPVGVVTINEISGYNGENQTVTSISGEEKTGKLETRTEAKNATVKMNVINNYQNKIDNISILGRIPFSGNKNTLTGEDLGSNLTTTLNRAITANGIDASKVTVYYSVNENATKDLTDANNAWTTSTENLANVKSYLIVLNEYEMLTGTTLEFSYGIGIPENLTYDFETYGIYTVYFNNVKENETIPESVTATKVGLTTGAGPVFEANVRSSVAEGVSIEEGENIKYTVTIKNTGKIAINNVKITSKFIQKEVVEESQNSSERSIGSIEKNVSQIKVGETVDITFTKTVQSKVKDEEIIKCIAQIIADNMEKPVIVESAENKVERGYLKLELDTGAIQVSDDRRVGQEDQYVLCIKNVNEIAKENVVVTNVLPNGVTFKEASSNATYDNNTRTVTWNLGTISSNSREYLSVTVVINDLSNGELEKNITNTMVVTTKDKTISKSVTTTVKKPLLKVNMTTEAPEEIEVGETIIYKVTIENIGKGTAESIRLIQNIPDGLQYKKTQYSLNGNTYSDSIAYDKVIVSLSALGAGSKVDITIEMKAEKLEKGVTKKDVTTKASISASTITAFETQEIKRTIVPKTTIKPDDPSIDKPQAGTHKISGMVWLDENNNGKRDENERKIPNITVSLIDVETGKVVTDFVTGRKKEQQTDKDGKYTFANLQQGKYMVMLQYDTNYYDLAKYQNEGVNDDSNSDVILANATINGETKKVAVTDKLTIGTNDILNIDMGLVEKAKFDLSLEKVVSKITVENGKNKVLEYKDAKLAKVDLQEKTIKDTTIIVEYKIRIKNEGDIAGYAKKIVDYLPKEMKFSSELNPEWYQSTTGNVYNSSLANTLINPGETKEITLILTKKMTENDTGVINNIAEIDESYNDLGIKDTDSISGNKVQNEDDMSSADVIIGIKTGEVYVYATLTIICIGMLGIGIYFINKKVLSKI